MHRRLSIVALVVLLTNAIPGMAHAAGAATGWVRPVPGAVVRPFVTPTGPYGAGHRGIDLAAPPGTPVRAAGTGTVTFSGVVGGTRHLVIRHDGGGWVTGYSFLASSTVSAGRRVRAGDVVGTSGGGGPGHDSGVVHVSLRVAGVYRDPAVLFGALDLGRAVHLVPWTPVVQTPSVPLAAARAPGLFHSVYLAVIAAAQRGRTR